MPKDLNLTRLSSVLTAKERAKLYITLLLKGAQELSEEDWQEPNADFTLSTSTEIQQLVSSWPPDQRREYRFYRTLFFFVLEEALGGITKTMLYLGVMDGAIERFRRDLDLAPLIYHVTDGLRHQPALVTRTEYEEALARARQQAREQILELEGAHHLTEQEAFARLLREGTLREWQGEEQDPLLGHWLEYVSRCGKTEEELLQESVTSLKTGIAGYLRDKRLTGKGQLWRDYERYAEYSDAELVTLVKEEPRGELTRPSQEQVEQWQAAIEAERQRVLSAVKDGGLQWAKRTEKNYDRDKKRWVDRTVEGVLAGSYYDWPERAQKFAGEEGATTCWHPLAEDCLPITYCKGKLTTPSEQMDQGTDWRPVAIAAPYSVTFDPFTSPEATTRRTEELLSVLTLLLPMEVKSKLLQYPVSFRLKPYVKASLQTFVKDVHEAINRIHTHIALIEAIETKHFDGMPLVSRDPQHRFGDSARALQVIGEVVSRHNDRLRDVVSAFNRLDRGLREFVCPELDEFLLTPTPTIDQKWLARRLALVEGCAG